MRISWSDSVPFLYWFCHFLKFLQLKNSTCQSATFGVTCPEPHQWAQWGLAICFRSGDTWGLSWQNNQVTHRQMWDRLRKFGNPQFIRQPTLRGKTAGENSPVIIFNKNLSSKRTLKYTLGWSRVVFWIKNIVFLSLHPWSWRFILITVQHYGSKGVYHLCACGGGRFASSGSGRSQLEGQMLLLCGNVPGLFLEPEQGTLS